MPRLFSVESGKIQAMRIIAHLDMDAFFAAVEERERPRLKGKPIAVGSDPEGGRGRGVVSTANYRARAYGIHSAMPISKAWELSEKAKKDGRPPVVFIGGSFHRYSEASDRIFELIVKVIAKVYPAKFSSENLERASVDEGYLDLSATRSFENAEKLARKIQKEIKTKERLTCSIGIGPNKLIAKIASDIKKPEGLTVVTEIEVENFIAPLPIRKIPGIGPKTEVVLNKKDVHIVEDLRKISKREMESMFGKWGSVLYEKSFGRDDSPIAGFEIAKSIGEQETFREDTANLNFITDRLKVLSEAIFRRFKENGFKTFKTIVVTVRFSNFETKNRSHTLSKSAGALDTLQFEAIKLLYPFFDKRENPQKRKIRLIGIRVEKLK